jgi:hypothetical protein
MACVWTFKIHIESTTDVTDFILNNMDAGNLTGAVYLDLKKAFDSVDSETLLFKLKCLGIHNREFEWFQNYINNRTQCVQQSSTLSDKLPISCGVPQGSILGPILFTVYVNDLVHSVHCSKIVLYADDTVLLFSAKTIDDITSSLADDLTRVSAWFTSNKLHLNVKKCKWTLFGSEKRLKKISLPEMTILDEQVEHVDDYKYLGVHLDKNLNWEKHVEKISAKIRQRLGVLRHIRDYLDVHTALKLYNALVMPITDYCDITYSSCSMKCQKKIQRLMLKGGKIVLNLPFDTPSAEVLQRLKWLTFRERSDFHKCIQMFKCLNSLSPDYLSSLFECVSHGYSTRQSSQLKVLKCKTNMGQRSFVYSGAILWNSLPLNVRSVSSLDAFKSNLLKHIVNSRA